MGLLYIDGEKMNKIKIGKIVNTKGLKGELKIYPYTDYPERFEEFNHIFIDDNEYIIEKVTYSKNNMSVIKLKGINTVEEALKMKDKFVSINRSEFRILDENEYFLIDLIGLNVFNNNEKIGVLTDVLTDRAQDIYIVKTDEREIMIPAVKKYIEEVNIGEGYIVVKSIEGL